MRQTRATPIPMQRQGKTHPAVELLWQFVFQEERLPRIVERPENDTEVHETGERRVSGHFLLLDTWCPPPAEVRYRDTKIPRGVNPQKRLEKHENYRESLCTTKRSRRWPCSGQRWSWGTSSDAHTESGKDSRDQNLGETKSAEELRQQKKPFSKKSNASRDGRTKNQYACKRSRRKHGPKQCPAYGKECSKCNKKGPLCWAVP